MNASVPRSALRAPSSKTAVVTGSAGGLGRALCVRLARQGMRIALVDLNEAENRETLRQVEAAGGEGRIETLDVTSREAWQALHDRLRADWPALDLLINNVGVAGGGEVGDFPLDDWDWLLEVDLKSVVYGCHTLVPWLKANPRGAHLVNVASFAAFACLPEMAAYNVAKSGVVALSETLRVELADAGVGVSVVCPGFFRTGLLTAARMRKPEQLEFAEEAMRTSGVTADDVAAAVLEAIASNRLYVVVGRKARRYWRLKRWLPNFFLWNVRRLFRKRRQAPGADR